MASTADFRNGMCMIFKDEIYTIVQFQHVKPGKGPAFVRTKLKNVKTGKVIDNTFTAGVKVDEVRVERRQYQYLYKDEMGFNLMNTETFEQISLPETMVENSDLMKESQILEIQFHADTETPLTAEMPAFVELRVIQTIEGEKGNTASSTAFPLSEGRAPGNPRQTGQVFILGLLPPPLGQAQKIFDAVFSSQ